MFAPWMLLLLHRAFVALVNEEKRTVLGGKDAEIPQFLTP